MTGILLAFLFAFFVESVKVEKKLEAARTEILSRQYLQTRLESILIGIYRTAANSPFYTKQFADEKNLSLVAIFDNGIDPDPAFCGAIMGRIYIDEEQNLNLATWPLEKSPQRPWRKEVLLSQVTRFEVEFLGQKKEGQKEKTKPVNATLEWSPRWPKSRTDMPTTVRLSIWQGSGDPLQFAFLLPSPDPRVTYWEGVLKS